ncbi:MAG: accessory factor UbiK family protein [Pseudomonadota bacterium]
MSNPGFDPRFIDDLARRLDAAMPERLRALREDVHGNFKAVLQSALGRMDLVTREEFDVRNDMLKRLYESVEQLEERIAELEGKSPQD